MLMVVLAPTLRVKKATQYLKRRSKRQLVARLVEG